MKKREASVDIYLSNGDLCIYSVLYIYAINALRCQKLGMSIVILRVVIPVRLWRTQR